MRERVGEKRRGLTVRQKARERIGDRVRECKTDVRKKSTQGLKHHS